MSDRRESPKRPRLIQPIVQKFFTPVQNPLLQNNNNNNNHNNTNISQPERFVGEHVEVLWNKNDDDYGSA
jgi:hypothetical protein